MISIFTIRWIVQRCREILKVNGDRSRLWRLNHPYDGKDKEVFKDYHRKASLRHYYRNQEKEKARALNWYRNNKARASKTKCAWIKKRRESDPHFRLIQNFRARIWTIIKNPSSRMRISHIIGCSKAALFKHLESLFKPGMTWNNYGKTWVVDHVFPVSRFDFSKTDSLKKCWHFKNLQPLFSLENKIKGNKIQIA
jgi:hypothetical protein